MCLRRVLVLLRDVLIVVVLLWMSVHMLRNCRTLLSVVPTGWKSHRTGSMWLIRPCGLVHGGGNRVLYLSLRKTRGQEESTTRGRSLHGMETLKICICWKIRSVLLLDHSSAHHPHVSLSGIRDTLRRGLGLIGPSHLLGRVVRLILMRVIHRIVVGP